VAVAELLTRMWQSQGIGFVPPGCEQRAPWKVITYPSTKAVAASGETLLAVGGRSSNDGRNGGAHTHGLVPGPNIVTLSIKGLGRADFAVTNPYLAVTRLRTNHFQGNTIEPTTIPGVIQCNYIACADYFTSKPRVYGVLIGYLP